MNPKPVTKAIIAAAGLGTRFLPQTKAMPKEMLPVIDKPVIQIIAEEAVSAGVTDIIIVTGSTKRAIEDHFDRAIEFESELIAKGKHDSAKQIIDIAEMANFIYIRQKGEPKGNARPVLNAAHLIGDEPFFVFFADDFFRSSIPRAKQLLLTYQRTGKSVVTMIKIPPEDSHKYGMCAIGNLLDGTTYEISGIIEKPDPGTSPSNYASGGCYLLTPDIWPVLMQERVGVGGEIVLADAINELAHNTQVYGRVVDGVWHDTGDKARYLEAIVDTALEDPKLGPAFRKYIESRISGQPGV